MTQVQPKRGIDTITIFKKASYQQETEIRLQPVTFLFGSNGVGKTTIGEVIRNPHQSDDGYTVTWHTKEKMVTLVYNQAFVHEHFMQSDDIRPIFTLGKETIDIQKKIREVEKEIETKTNENENDNVNKRSIVDEWKKKRDEIVTTCWYKKPDKTAALGPCFNGYHGDKNLFFEALLKVHETLPNEDPPSWKNLDARATILHGDDSQEINPLTSILADELAKHETNDILQKPVIGKDTIGFSELITQLSNSDWVMMGMEHHKNTDHQTCPFCQQPTSDVLKEKLDAFFDQTFQSDMDAIQTLSVAYKTEADRVCGELQTVITQLTNPELSKISQLTNEKEKNQTGDLNEVKNNLNSLQQKLLAIINTNKERLTTKVNNPSQSITLDSSEPIRNDIQTTLNAANEIITVYNDHIKNKKKHQALLKTQAWQRVCFDLKDTLTSYTDDKTTHDQAIKKVEDTIKQNKRVIQELNDQLKELRQKTTSVQPTVDAINDYLKPLTPGFKLKTTEDETSYQLIRTDGSDAKKTLSEGEKTLVTFLYFYHMIKGSTEANQLNEKKVVVFDDPISSLDHQSLFFVSTLIRTLINDVLNEGTSPIQQIVVLTHNVYFYQEVTFGNDKNKNKGVGFLTVRKHNGSSIVTDGHPAKSLYHLLWVELFDQHQQLTNNKDPLPHAGVGLGNTMRRILECYFKFAGIEYKKFQRQKDKNISLDPKKEILWSSLLSWVNRESHDPDLLTPPPDASVEPYMNTFKEIFEEYGHGDHYKMMKQIYGKECETSPKPESENADRGIRQSNQFNPPATSPTPLST